MDANIEKLIQLRDIAILTKSPMQFGLISLLINLEYGTEFEETNTKEEELTL